MEKDIKDILDKLVETLCDDGSMEKMHLKNVKTKKEDTIVHNINNMPKEVIFNGDYTILKWDDEEIKLKRNKEDKHDPIYAFVYGYFVHQIEMSKDGAKKFLDLVERIGRNEEEIKLDEIEKLLDENLDLESYFKKFKKIMNKN